jgi:hypothetical protein
VTVAGGLIFIASARAGLTRKVQNAAAQRSDEVAAALRSGDDLEDVLCPLSVLSAHGPDHEVRSPVNGRWKTAWKGGGTVTKVGLTP